MNVTAKKSFGKIKAALLFFGAALLFVSACQKAYDVPEEKGVVSALSLSVADTSVRVVVNNGADTLSRQAYRLTVKDNSGRNPATGEPVIYNLYKIYLDSLTGEKDRWNLVARLFGGGSGFAAGSKVSYTDVRGEKTVLAVWIVETGSDRPRLITCYLE